MFAGMVPSVLVMPIFNLHHIEVLMQYEEAGYYLLKHFPTTSLTAYALLDRHYSLTHPSEYTFEASRFQSALSTLQLISDYSFIPELDANSVYAQQEKIYLFGNPCTYNQAVLDKTFISLDTCLNL